MINRTQEVFIGHTAESWVETWVRLTRSLRDDRPDIEYAEHDDRELWEVALRSLNAAEIPLPPALKVALWAAEAEDNPGTIRRYLATFVEWVDGDGVAVEGDFAYPYLNGELSARLEGALGAWAAMTPQEDIHFLVVGWIMEPSQVTAETERLAKDLDAKAALFMAKMREHQEAHTPAMADDSQHELWNVEALDIIEASGLPSGLAHALFWKSAVTDELDHVRAFIRVTLKMHDLAWSDDDPSWEALSEDLRSSLEAWVYQSPSEARNLLRRWPDPTT